MKQTRAHLGTLVDDFENLAGDIAVVARVGLRHKRTTYGQLAVLAKRFAAELEHRGITKGDRVLLCGENNAEWIAAFFGCVLRGVLPVPVDVASTPEFLRKIESEVAPKLAVADRGGFGSPVIRLEDFADRLTAEQAPAVPLVPSDALQIVFTSGTTGEPKGVVHTHANVLASLTPIEREAARYLKYERPFHPIRFLHTLPLSHVFGQFMGLWLPAVIGAEVHYESRLVASDLIRQIKRERISVLCAVPRVVSLLRQQVEPAVQDRIGLPEVSAWKRWWRYLDVHRQFGLKFWAIICGGAALTPADEQFWQKLGFVVVQGYGMTETTALVSLNHPFKAAKGSVGQVLPGREVKLGEDGEVMVRGDTISHLRWQNARFQPVESEWLRTGDLGEFDAAGNLRFRGRKKDVIVTAAGLNIYPEDIEAVLKKQEGVRDCAVVEQQTAEGPEALAVLLMAGDADSATAVAGANAELAEFQHVRNWVTWPEPDLPRTSTGKVLRRELTERIAAGDLIAHSDSSLNLDSLGRVELQAKLEQQYGVAVDDAAVQQIQSEADIARALQRQASAKDPHVYPKWPWNRAMQALRTVFLGVVAMPLVRFLGKPATHVSVPQIPRTPMLIVCNHVTAMDVPLILYALPASTRDRVAVAMSGELLLGVRRITYWLITGLFNVFPLPQKSGFRRSFQHAGEAVDRGYSVIVFPEGRRSDDGTPAAFMRGAGLLWKELGVPALAVRLEGLGELKASKANWFRTGKVAVRVLRVLPLDASKSPDELTAELQRAVFQGFPAARG